MTAFTAPCVISDDGQSKLLERIQLTQGADGTFNEAWLQRALFQHPTCLPVKEIDPHMGALTPICMELETGAGPADLLYVTATGQIVLAETKLWRNPEARREVLAQVLDYAKQLSNWQYEDLDRETARASKAGAGHLLRTMQSTNGDLDTASFVDGINRTLRAGGFLLLIIGDGIRSGAEALVGFLQQSGNLRFGLGLIEVAAYRINQVNILLQPRVLARTEVLTRVVIVDQHGEAVEEQQVLAASVEDELRPEAVWFETFWKEFASDLKLDDSVQPLPPKTPKSTNYYLTIPSTSGQAWFSAYLMQSKREAGVYLRFTKPWLKREKVYDSLLSQREEIERDFGGPIEWIYEQGTGKVWISGGRVNFRDLNNSEDRQRVIAYLRATTNRMVNVFRHRISALVKEE